MKKGTKLAKSFWVALAKASSAAAAILSKHFPTASRRSFILASLRIRKLFLAVAHASTYAVATFTQTSRKGAATMVARALASLAMRPVVHH